MTHADIVVLGGGLSGLAAACALEQARADYLLVERCPSLGGLTRTTQVGDFCFDYTGHFLHLQRYASPEKVPFANLRDQDWRLVERRSCCYVASTMVTAPIQYHVGELPSHVREECIKSYDQRPRCHGNAPSSFREYLVRNFGDALADLFLIPQNEKTLSISLERLSSNAVKRFFPPPDDVTIRRGMNGEAARTPGYNNCFWYPKRGGIDALTCGLAEKVGNICLNQECCVVDLNERSLSTRSGLKLTWDTLLTSVPLPSFCRMTGEPDLLQASEHLTHSSTIAVNIGLSGETAKPLQGLHWVYVPDPKIPFYRVGVFSHISEGTCSPGHSALYAEVGIPGEQLDQTELAVLEKNVLSALERLGWIDLRRITCVVAHVLRCAYVHHTPEAEVLVQRIGKRLTEANVFPIGRYGRWDYTSMEDSIYDGISTAEKVIQ